MNKKEQHILSSIEDTKKHIELIKTEYAKLGLPQFIVDLEVSSLRKRLESLNNEFNEVTNFENRKELVVTFHPPGFSPGQIPVRTLSSILNKVQSLTDAIANSLYNRPSSNTGPIPQDILDRNSLIIKEVKAGSFKVSLDLPRDNQITFNESDSSVINELFELFYSSQNEENILEKISNLGDRVLSKYIDFLKSLKDYNTPLEIDWCNSSSGINKFEFNFDNLDKIYSNLNDNIDVKEEVIEVSGVLTGGNIRTKSFEIYTLNNEKISGSISKSFSSQLNLGNKCIANILKITSVNKVTKKSNTSQILNSISEI